MASSLTGRPGAWAPVGGAGPRDGLDHAHEILEGPERSGWIPALHATAGLAL